MRERGALTSGERRQFNELVTTFLEYDAVDPGTSAGAMAPQGWYAPDSVRWSQRLRAWWHARRWR